MHGQTRMVEVMREGEGQEHFASSSALPRESQEPWCEYSFCLDLHVGGEGGGGGGSLDLMSPLGLSLRP